MLASLQRIRSRHHRLAVRVEHKPVKHAFNPVDFLFVFTIIKVCRRYFINKCIESLIHPIRIFSHHFLQSLETRYDQIHDQ